MPGGLCCARNCCLGTTCVRISHTDIPLTDGNLDCDALNVLLTVHHNISVQQSQQDALFVFSFLEFHSNPASSQPTQHTQNIPTAVYTAPPDDEQTSAQNMYRLPIAIN
jgi:hypothetical protein